jgi:hypothetical protein
VTFRSKTLLPSSGSKEEPRVPNIKGDEMEALQRGQVTPPDVAAVLSVPRAAFPFLQIRASL